MPGRLHQSPAGCLMCYERTCSSQGRLLNQPNLYSSLEGSAPPTTSLMNQPMLALHICEVRKVVRTRRGTRDEHNVGKRQEPTGKAPDQTLSISRAFGLGES